MTPWKTGDLDLKKLVEASAKLKDSADVKDRLRYIPSMKAIVGAGLEPDAQFEPTLAKWLADSHEPFQLRKQVLLYEWTDKNKPLPGLLAHFTRDEQVQLLQNFLDTPRYKDLVVKNDSQLAEFMVTARANKKVRDNLLEAYSPSNTARPLISHVLDAADVPDAKASELAKSIKSIKSSLSGKPSIESILETQKLASGTSLEKSLRDELLNTYAASVHSGSELGRALSQSLHAENAAVRDFGQRLIAKASDPAFAKFPVLRAFENIQAFQTKGGYADFHQAAKAWMASNEVPAELKSDFLLSNFSSKNEHLYEEYRAAVPPEQLAGVTRGIDRETNLGVFERLTAESPVMREKLFANAKIEAFEYRAHVFPEGGKQVKLGSPATEAGRNTDETLRDVTLTKPFEMQSTPVTQLQWAMVMKENPSYFKPKTPMDASTGYTQMNPNRPVEQVSWDDVQKYIAKLNELDPHHSYRLPTEAEWEYAARAGTTTAYSFGDSPAQIGEYAWDYQNAGNQTHDVAELKPNPRGLYDMHGNVWEWTQDWYGNYPAGAVTDPTGPPTGSHRVFRGGSWSSSPQYLRSARRGRNSPGLRSYSIGFRLVRTPK
ncbi:MAG: formylglycine-generating enzyme family protein [Bdellovibrionales bacterium]|nr:formylglycine-generating enzyme family protein [Bdellovibrionales bacterium]